MPIAAISRAIVPPFHCYSKRPDPRHVSPDHKAAAFRAVRNSKTNEQLGCSKPEGMLDARLSSSGFSPAGDQLSLR
jgi:hypothetical protein